MITVQPLETSVRELTPSTLVYVIRGGWALAYCAEMLDDRANEIYVASEWPAPARLGTLPRIWRRQLAAAYLVDARDSCAAYLPDCAGLTIPESEFRARYGLPVDIVQHPR